MEATGAVEMRTPTEMHERAPQGAVSGKVFAIRAEMGDGYYQTGWTGTPNVSLHGQQSAGVRANGRQQAPDTQPEKRERWQNWEPDVTQVNLFVHD